MMKEKTRSKAIIDVMSATRSRPRVTFRYAGEDWLLIQYGEEPQFMGESAPLDYMLHFRVRTMVNEIASRNIRGLIQIMPAWRTLSCHFDSRIMGVGEMLEIAKDCDRVVGGNERVAKAVFPSRFIELPIAFEESQTREAVRRYLASIKPGSIDCDPERLSNLTWLAQINGLSREEFKRDILRITWYVFAIGFTIGLPICQPLERKYFLHTSKHNPPRTWSPRGGVCVGGLYSVESPGGFPLLGRTTPILQLSQNHPSFRDDPILFRHGDRFRFYEVDEAELLRLEKLIDEGAPEFVYKVIPGELRVEEWLESEERDKAEVEARMKRVNAALASMPVP